MKKLTALLLTLTMLAVIPSISAAEPKSGGKLIFGLNTKLRMLDPHKIFSYTDARNMGLICESLVTIDRDFKFVPGLAVSWEASSDNTVWTFRLRKGVKFHNGREFTAEDVKFNFDRMRDKKFRSSMMARLKMLKETVIVDPYTVKFIMGSPNVAFLANQAGFHHRAFIVAKESVNEKGQIKNPIGTGPFVWGKAIPDGEWSLKKFNDYWMKGIPRVNELVFKPIVDNQVRLNALRSGELDLANGLPVAEVKHLMEKKRDKKVTYSLHAEGNTTHILLNHKKKPMGDINFRKALAYAIDKAQLLDGVTLGTGSITNQKFHKGQKWFCAIPDYRQDVNKAKDYLRKAGYPSGLEVTFSSPQQPLFIKLIAVLEQQFKAVGITLKIEVMEFAAYAKKIRKGDWEIALGNNGPLADPDIIYPDFYHPKGRLTWRSTGRGYINEELGNIFDKARTISDYAKRKALYKQATEIIVDELPTIWLFSVPDAFGWGNYVKGFSPHITSQYIYSDGGLGFLWLDK